MTGSEQPGVVIQKRDIHLLHEVSAMRVIDREQAKLVAGFGSTTRVNARLLRLTRAGLLRRFFLGTTRGGAKALYTLSTKGAWLADVPQRGPRRASDRVLVGDFFVQHQLALNEIYCALKYKPCPPGVRFNRWLTFQEPVIPALPLVPDGYVELETSAGTVAAFLEVDLGHERLKVWVKKAKSYYNLVLSEDFQRQFRVNRVRTLVVANTPGRMQSIRKAIAPVADELFRFTSLPAITRGGIFGSHWLQANGDEPQPLLRETP